MDDMDYIPPLSSSSSESLVGAVSDSDSPISSSVESEHDLSDTIVDHISEKVLALVNALNRAYQLELKADERRDAADGMCDVLLRAYRDARTMSEENDSVGDE